MTRLATVVAGYLAHVTSGPTSSHVSGLESEGTGSAAVFGLLGRWPLPFAKGEGVQVGEFGSNVLVLGASLTCELGALIGKTH